MPILKPDWMDKEDFEALYAYIACNEVFLKDIINIIEKYRKESNK